MAHLYRQWYTRKNSETGEREKHRVRKWYGKYRDASGVIRKIPLCEDKEAAQAMLTDFVRRIDREKAGFVDPADAHLSSSIDAQIQAYRNHLEANARSESHVGETLRLINNIAGHCKVRILAELQTADEAIQGYLAARRRDGKSHRTVNADLAAIRSFCRWLLERQRISRDPTISLKSLNVKRRALTARESEQLIATTLCSERVFRRLTGKDRAVLYMLSQRTGLRKNELRSLTPSSFDFSTSPAVVTVEAGNSKRRRTDRLPLTPDLKRVFGQYLKDKSRNETIWPGSWWRKAAIMLRLDLADAEIEPEDDQGRVIDFHGQRTTFITGLSRAGVSPAVAQKLARHSDINLTMGVYTQLDMEELGEAVEQLPPLIPPATPEKKPEHDAAEKQLEQLNVIWKNLSDEIRAQVMNTVRGQAGQADG